MVDTLLVGGAAGGVLGTIVAVFRMAVAAERRRADDWRETGRTRSEANRVNAESIGRLSTSVEQLAASQRETTASQREMMALLQAFVGNHRSPP